MQSRGSSNKLSSMIARTRISSLLLSMFATFASIYVAGRLVFLDFVYWQLCLIHYHVIYFLFGKKMKILTLNLVKMWFFVSGLVIDCGRMLRPEFVWLKSWIESLVMWAIFFLLSKLLSGWFWFIKLPI